MALQRDGWWLNAPVAVEAVKRPRLEVPQNWRAGLLAGLIVLGDVLIWDVMPGVSLAVFCAAVVLAAFLVVGRKISAQRQALIAGGTVLVLLPLVELVQPLSIMIAVFGVSAMLALIAGVEAGGTARAMARLWPLGLRQTCVDLLDSLQTDGKADRSGQLRRWAFAWFLPLTLGVVFVVLLLAANPIAERWLEVVDFGAITRLDPDRIAFWACLTPLAWTALSLTQMHERLRALPTPARMGPRKLGLINPASVTRALVLFNAVFAVQTGLDLVYLYGGLGLPEGITYAEYAHRGAYPLVATALLAGGFALLTRPWVQGDALLRGLLMLWVAQNVALVVSSLVRLELYVGVYGLTHLRLAAAIWMGVVAAGLGLILWQVWQRCDNSWLMLRGGAMGAGVLYACAFVSFDATIARYNLSHPVKLDRWYLCQLGDAAKPIIVGRAPQICAPHQLRISTPQDWREWGFRNARARFSLAAVQTEARP